MVANAVHAITNPTGYVMYERATNTPRATVLLTSDSAVATAAAIQTACAADGWARQSSMLPAAAPDSGSHRALNHRSWMRDG